VKQLKFIDSPKDRKKINKAFRRYDKDKSGSLDKDEIEKFAEDLVTYFIAKHPDRKLSDAFHWRKQYREVKLFSFFVPLRY